MNTELEVRHALGLAARYRFHPSYAIYEPGFVRLGATLHWRCSCPAPIYRFMFSQQFAFCFPPKPYALAALVALVEEEADAAPWMISGLGAAVRFALWRTVQSAGGAPQGSCC